MGRTRVLVVEDSLTIRRRLCEVLSADPDLEVIAEAEDGKKAIELCQRLRPDVMTLDMHLPLMSGLAATEYIMAHCPTPILIVSSSANRSDLFKTYEALAAGAVDVLEKPTGDETDDSWDKKLVAAVKLVAKIRVITHPRARLRAHSVPAPAAIGGAAGTAGAAHGAAVAAHGAAAAAAPAVPRVIAIGASTGGPGALVEVLGAIPRFSTVPILVVLHIGELFGTAFAEWLDEQTPHRVSNATEGLPLAQCGGRIILGPPGRHMVVRSGTISLTNDAERHSCRPSIDVLFESVAREYGRSAIGCLLTGMGRDGASGLLEIRTRGGRTIAQDEATSVVYGMPREAALMGAAERVLPLGEIGSAIAGYFR